MENFGKGLWVFNGGTVRFLTFPFSTRMTIIELPDNKLWVHSPIKMTAELKVQVDALGTVSYLIAPNHLHHLFLADWQESYPNALTYGTDEVIAKRPDLTFNYSFNTEVNYPWSGYIKHLLFTGSKAMQESVFFHNASKTLIVTDLIENFSPSAFNKVQRLVAKGVGILAPVGKMPIDWRLSFIFTKAEARKHILELLSWQPEKIIMAHGKVIETEATKFLRESFSWLKI